jgi:hypothetical protein
MKLRSAGIRRQEMIRVALTDAAYDAIASMLPKGAARGPCSAIRKPYGMPHRADQKLARPPRLHVLWPRALFIRWRRSWPIGYPTGRSSRKA